MCKGIRLSVIVVALLFVVSKVEGNAWAAEGESAENSIAGNTEQAAASVEPTASPSTGGALTATPTEDTSQIANPDGLQLVELIVAKGIEAKKPLDPKSSYKLGEFERIVAYMLVKNPTETANEISVSFLNVESGKERGKVTVSVGAQKKWRTWAFSRMVNKAGKWEVVVRDKNDNIIGRTPFEIVE